MSCDLEYIIIQSDDRADLEAGINMAIEIGYVPHGSLTFHRDQFGCVYIQPMVDRLLFNEDAE